MIKIFRLLRTDHIIRFPSESIDYPPHCARVFRGEGRGGGRGEIAIQIFPPRQFNLIPTICPIRGNCTFKFIVMAPFIQCCVGTIYPHGSTKLPSDGLNRIHLTSEGRGIERGWPA